MKNYRRSTTVAIVAAALVLGGCASSEPAQPAAAPAPPPAPAAAEEQSVQTWVGPVPGTPANIAIQTFADGRAQAYVCDGGNLVSLLFEGKQAADGSLRLAGPNGALVEANPDGRGWFEGTVVVVDRPISFVTEPARPPGGYYKAGENDLGLRWVVLNDGKQSGIGFVNGAPGSAPILNPSAGTVIFNGKTLPTERVSRKWTDPEPAP